MFDGMGVTLGDLHRLSSARTRSVSPENPTGGKGLGGMADVGPGTASFAARELGRGWKVQPYVNAAPGETLVLCDLDGPGCLQHVWMTLTGNLRHQVLRIYWDGQERPSVECPPGDFFACGWGEFAPVSSLAVCVNPGSAFNSYWPMPFRKHCRMTLENRGDQPMKAYFQIDYAEGPVSDDAAYFHAQFRRSNPLPYKSVHTLLDGVRGQGQYVGTYLAWGVNNAGWWGEGEIKFFLDGDGEFPTICGTGTEDYFCGSYDFVNQKAKQYQEFSTPYCGLPQVIRPDGVYRSQTRFGLYRWHIADPVRFSSDLKVTIQALGWRPDGRYLPLQDDIASTAFWYQTLPTAPFPALPDRDACEIV